MLCNVPTFHWVLLGSGNSNKGYNVGSLYLELVCRRTLPLPAAGTAHDDMITTMTVQMFLTLREQASPSVHMTVRKRVGCRPNSHMPWAKGQSSPRGQMLVCNHEFPQTIFSEKTQKTLTPYLWTLLNLDASVYSGILPDKAVWQQHAQ